MKRVCVFKNGKLYFRLREYVYKPLALDIDSTSVAVKFNNESRKMRK